MTTLQTQHFIFHSDAGHGWLEVPTHMAKDLGILHKISSCSYMSRDRKTLYLEEDCDAPIFFNELEKHTTWEYEEQYDGDDSFIRRLPCYDMFKVM